MKISFSLFTLLCFCTLSSGIALGQNDYIRNEAENAKLIPNKDGHKAGVAERDMASGKAAVEHFQKEAGIEFSDIPESNRITVHYATEGGAIRFIDVYINDETTPAAIIPYQPTGGWMTYKTLTIPVYIPNKARVKLISRSDSVNIDCVDFHSDLLYPTKPKGFLPIDTAKLGQGAGIISDNMALMGKALELKQGDATLKISPKLIGKNNCAVLRYSTEKPTSLSLVINKGDARSIELPATGKKRYGTYLIQNLTPSSENTLHLKSLEGSILVDGLEFSYLPNATKFHTEAIPPQKSSRQSISLNGLWECTLSADTDKDIPKEFDNRMPVPGLWDIASHPLGDYAGKSLWYRQKVKVGAIPTRAILKIGKAQFGRYIYINGQLVDDYSYNFTASETDITPYLKANQDNEIVIRLQNADFQKTNPENKGHIGHDGERKNFWPGIYDDTELIITDNPAVKYMQVAPNIEKGSITAKAFLTNNTDKECSSPVTVNIYRLGNLNKEKSNPELVATYTQEKVTLPANGETTLNIPEMALKGFQRENDLWTPQNPVLYQMEIITNGDKIAQRFGMRTFRFDAEKKLAILNEEPIYLRGTNIVFNRFCDDPMRKDLPWKKDWARQLYAEFKKVNFECFRTHAAFVPEKWYDLADEMGLMIMDEYPFWQNCNGEKCNAETLTPEIKNWMMERGMHPSVIVWDIANESFHGWLADVWEACRPLDIQNRPGDLGWVHTKCPTDMKETHPYLYSEPDFTLGYLNSISQVPWTFGNKSDDLTLIINEYGWNWINRIGEPTLLGKNSYDFIMPDATNEERIQYNADSLAELTEFWRVGRQCKGILQFSGLSYSLPGQQGQTGDILKEDITTPRIREALVDRLHDSFAPLGIAIEDYTEQVLPGQTMTIPVTLINDLNESIKGQKVRLRLFQGDSILFDESQSYDADPLSLSKKNFTLTVPSKDKLKKAPLKLVAEYTRDKETIRSQRFWKAESRDYGIAFRKPVEASSFFKRTYYHFMHPANVNDGASNTRWHSGKDDVTPWITIDLGSPQNISRVYLHWAEVLGKKYFPERYEIQVSDDGKNFTKIHEGTASDATVQDIPVTGKGRYIRMQVTGKMPEKECALWEFDVWGK